MTKVQQSLVSLITEIVLRGTAKVCVGFSPARIETVANPLIEGILDMVILQGNMSVVDDTRHFSVRAPNYHCFELWNRIIDEIEKEIPVASKIEVTATVTRSQRQNFNAGTWRDQNMTRREIAELHKQADQ